MKLYQTYFLSLQDSQAVKGTQKLLEDALKAGAVILGVATALVFLFFLGKALLPSDQERGRAIKHAITTLIIGGIATLASALTSTVLGYYQ